jgi:hypothetical protein
LQGVRPGTDARHAPPDQNQPRQRLKRYQRQQYGFDERLAVNPAQRMHDRQMRLRGNKAGRMIDQMRDGKGGDD